MNETERRQLAVKELKGLLDEWSQHADDGADALSIDHRIVTTIQISVGGPSSWIEYDHLSGSATYYTTGPDYASRKGGADRVELMTDEANLVESIFALDDNARMAMDDGSIEF